MFIITALLFLSASAYAQAPGQSQGLTSVDAVVHRATELHLEDQTEWRRLLHYVPLKIGRGVESQADNPKFFLSPDGATNPHAELEATLRKSLSGEILPPALENTPAMAAICQFPARWNWLKVQLQIEASLIPKVDCKEYEEFRARLRAKSATVVFSAYYVNNPSTVYGHVLLRLNRERNGASRGAELLDYGVGYAANMGGADPITMAIKGVGGFFRGVFSTQQYFYKVREYSDAESRDLWEYDLDLKPDEVDRLVDHIWEMGSNYFDYYYLTENCAYHLLSVLEAAAPRLNLIARMPYIVMPVDSVKAISQEPGLVTHVHYRPSTQKQLETRYELLSSKERSAFLRVRDDEKPADHLGNLSSEESAHVLDAVLDDIDHRHFKALVYKSDPVVAARKQNVLAARARLPAGGRIEVPYTEKDRPDHSHGTRRWSLGLGSAQSANVSEGTTNAVKTQIDAEYRFSLHSLNDPLEGYLPYSNVELGRFRFRYLPADNHFDLKEFNFMTVSSLAPLSRLTASTAWRMSLGAKLVRDQRCDECLATYAIGLGGVSVAPAKPMLTYFLMGPVGETASSFTKEKWLASYAALAGFRWKLSPSWQLAAEGEWRRVFDRETFDRRELNVLARWDAFPRTDSQWALEAEFKHEVLSQDLLVRYLHYF